MGKSRHRKNHAKKLKARQDRMKQEKSKVAKMQREFIMNLIKKEQEKGLFDNTQAINPTTGPIIEGPIIDGPIIDTPVVDSTNTDTTISGPQI